MGDLLAITAGQLVALVFLAAGASKPFSRAETSRSIDSYDLLPHAIVPTVAAALPWLELAIALSLLTGIGGACAAVAALVLLLVFSIAQATVLFQGREVPCGCFGSLASRPVQWANVWINLALAACCLLALSAFPDFFGLRWLVDLSSEGSTLVRSPADVLLLQLIVAALLIQLVAFNQLFVNRRHERDYQEHQRAFANAAAIQKVQHNAVGAEVAAVGAEVTGRV